MTTRTIVSLLGGLLAALVALVGSWLIVESYRLIGWQIPLAAGVAVFTALWVVDFLTDTLAKRQQ